MTVQMRLKQMNDNESRGKNLLLIRLDLARIIEALGVSSHLNARQLNRRVAIAKEHLKFALKELDSALEGEHRNRN